MSDGRFFELNTPPRTGAAGLIKSGLDQYQERYTKGDEVAVFSSFESGFLYIAVRVDVEKVSPPELVNMLRETVEAVNRRLVNRAGGTTGHAPRQSEGGA